VHPKKGLTKNMYVLRYIVVSYVDEKRKLALACLPVRTDDKLADIVKTLLEKAKSQVLIDTVLFDRGFYNATILKTVKEMGMRYVIPLRKSTGTDQIWLEPKKNGEYKLQYTIKGETDQVQSWLYLDEKKKEDKKVKGKRKGYGRKGRDKKKRKEREYVGVLSNMDVCSELMQDFMDWYFVRNNVETCFKEKNQYKIRTCSTDKAYRFLIYCISLYLMNLVQIVRIVNNTFFRNDEMKKLLELLLRLDKLVEEYRLSRTLIVVA
jgi:IS4 transposase